MELKLIDNVKDFKLLYNSEFSEYLIVKILNSKKEILIAKILLPIGAVIPSLCALEDHLQNYVVTFEEYQNFIRLVDEAYFRFETKKME